MTKKQKLFVEEYLVDLNATQAYIRAGYKYKNNNVAGVEGVKLLRKPNIQAEIARRIKEREKRVEVSQDRIIEELANLSFTDRTDIVSISSGRLVIKDFDELTEAQKSCISGVKETKFGIEITFYNKEKSLELLGRHLGIFTDKVELRGEVNTNNPFSGLTTEELKKVISSGDK